MFQTMSQAGPRALSRAQFLIHFSMFNNSRDRRIRLYTISTLSVLMLHTLHWLRSAKEGVPSINAASQVEAYGYVSAIMIRSLVCSVIMALISGSTVVMRISSRRRRAKNLVLEDYLIMFAWILGIISNVLSHSKDMDGFGVASVSDMDLLAIFQRLFYAQQFFYLALFLVQASVCLNYRSFSAGIVNRHSMACDVVLGCALLGTIAEIVVYSLQCLPINIFWTLIDRSKARCFAPKVSQVLVIFGPPIFRCLIDLALMCIPIPLVVKLRLRPVQKVAVIAVIAVSLLSIFANIERLRISTISPPIRGPSEYFSSVFPQLQLLSVMEVNTAITCANAVTLKAPLTEAWERFSTWRRGERRPSLATSDSSVSTRSHYSGMEKSPIVRDL